MLFRSDYGQPISDYFPRIITDKDFYAAQTQVSMRRKERYFEKSNFVNLFSGLVFNGADRQIMHLETNKKYKVWYSELLVGCDMTLLYEAYKQNNKSLSKKLWNKEKNHTNC